MDISFSSPPLASDMALSICFAFFLRSSLLKCKIRLKRRRVLRRASKVSGSVRAMKGGRILLGIGSSPSVFSSTLRLDIASVGTASPSSSFLSSPCSSLPLSSLPLSSSATSSFASSFFSSVTGIAASSSVFSSGTEAVSSSPLLVTSSVVSPSVGVGASDAPSSDLAGASPSASVFSPVSPSSFASLASLSRFNFSLLSICVFMFFRLCS
mmetsp:Transcript_22238/g.48271  ORF Transcript_22238/g.48271 Transcript_22238/m.48271 type:complete len:211 (+) Transcript_22238:1271-1903(+)